MQLIRRTPLSVAATLVCLCPTVTSQSPSQVLGLTDSSPVLVQIDPNFCTQTSCSPTIGGSISPWAGGVAHDPADRATWISDGTVLMKVDSRTGCNTICGPFPAPNLTAGTEVTGLAYNESLRLLFVTHSDNQIFTYQTSVCALTLLSSCLLPVPPNHIVSGLASDDASGTLFYSSSPWLGPSSPTEINVSSQASPCVPICPPYTPVNTAGLVPDVTGLGFDSCRQALFFTDGVDVFELPYSGACGFAPFPTSICPGVVGQLLTGLCVLPSTEVNTAPACFGGSTPFCPTMRHTLVGDPAIGNLTFGFELQNCPAPSIAILFLDLGSASCNALNIGFCSNVPSFPIFSSLQFVGGTGCNGFASTAFPLPPTTALCGIILSSRWAGMLSPGAPSDTFVSNCLSWMISAT